MTSNMFPNKRVLEQGPCPSCASSDAYTVYTDGRTIDAFCFSCNHFDKDPYGNNSISQESQRAGDSTDSPTPRVLRNERGVSSSGVQTRSAATPYRDETRSKGIGVQEGLTHPIKSLRDRKISQATCERYGVRVGVSSTDGETPIYTLFPRHRDGSLVGFKSKTKDKHYSISGGSDVDLFGLHTIPSKGKKLWITEGEEDCLALYQALKQTSSYGDWEPAVVSVPDGATSAVSSITRCMDRLTGFDDIIIVFDNDVPGKKARDEVCKILAGKVSYVELPLKDANEMLMEGKESDLKWLCLTHNKKYQPDGIVNAKDLWERFKSVEDVKVIPYPSFLPVLNEKIYGARPGTIVTVTAGTGCGKTQFLRELMFHYIKNTEEKISGLFLEEDSSETISGLISLQLNQRIHLPDVERNDELERAAFDSLFSSGRVNLYDYFGGMDDGNLLGKLRYFAATGSKLIFLDHLSIVVSEYAAEGGERERIDTLMTKLAKFVKETGVTLFLVVHLRKGDSAAVTFEQGAVPTLDDLRGSASLKQLSWDILGLARNTQDPNPRFANKVDIHVLKSRFTGRTGKADTLYFDEGTGRLSNSLSTHAISINDPTYSRIDELELEI